MRVSGLLAFEKEEIICIGQDWQQKGNCEYQMYLGNDIEFFKYHQQDGQVGKKEKWEVIN